MDGDSAAGHGIDAIWNVDRGYLLRVAARVLGNDSDAEDVVQDAFGRLARVDVDEIDDVRGWLAVVVRHLALDRLRSAHARHETVAGQGFPDIAQTAIDDDADPADRVTMDDQVQLALAVVLDRLSPAERTAFVLHDVFGFPFADIATIVGRTDAACRQLATRARRSIRSNPTPIGRDAEVTTHRVLMERFIAACAGGDIAGLMEILDPDVVGVATLADRGPIARVAGRAPVAKRVIALFGPGVNRPGAHRSMVPFAVEDRPAIAVIDDHRVGVMIFEEQDGLIRHIDTFVRPQPPGASATLDG